MPLSVTVVYHFNMQASVQRASNSYLNGHAFVQHNGNASITIGDSDHGSAKWWFAICKAQQWGTYSAIVATGTVNFPLAFNSIVLSITSSPSGTIKDYWYINRMPYNITLTGFTRQKADIESLFFYYIVLGVQQWGYFDDSTSNADYTIAPILSISKLFWFGSIVKNSYGARNAEGNPRVEYKSSASIYFSSGVASHRVGVYYFIVCMQQWGLTSVTSQGQKTITLPITYNSNAYIVLKSAYDESPYTGNTTYYYGVVWNLLKSSFQVHEGSYVGLRRSMWISIGV